MMLRPAAPTRATRARMLKVFPQLADVKIEYQWGGMIGIGANRLPQIGKLKDQPNVFYAQAYSGHGVNATHLAGKLLGEIAAVEDKVHVHDLQATILHCLGMDHTRLTYRFRGRDFRLTDIAGELVKPLLA